MIETLSELEPIPSSLPTLTPHYLISL